jgi:tetratricopeptide (TPR) repeat protein
LYIVPWPEGWTVVFYTDTSNYGLPRRWNKSAVALSLDVPLRTLDKAVEVLQIYIEQKSHFEASLEIAWDKASISAPFEIPSQSNALEDAFPASGGPSFDDYYMAAQFCYETADFRGALMRIDMGLELNQRKPYFYLQLKALVEAKLGNTDSAIRYAQLAAQGAKEAGDFYFAQSVESTIADLPASSASTTPLAEGNA